MERWERCSICRELPASMYESRDRGALDGDPLPAATHQLAVVGAPVFNDYADRGTCTKRCPECGTLYAWERDYEFEVAAMVDTIDVTLRRLDDVAGAAAVAAAEAEVVRARAELQRGIAAQITNLESTDPATLTSAASALVHAQLVYGEDLAFAIPALVAALARHAHTRRCELGRMLRSLLEPFAHEQHAELGELLRKARQRPEIKALREHFR